MTVWVAEAAFPFVSVVLHVTIVVPKGKEAGASFIIDETPIASSELASPRTTTLFSMLVASTITSTGTFNIGGVVSTTIIV